MALYKGYCTPLPYRYVTQSHKSGGKERHMWWGRGPLEIHKADEVAVVGRDGAV